MQQTVRLGLIPLMKLEARDLRNLGSFTAEDPWNGNRPSEFQIEECVMMPDVAKKVIDSKAGGFAHVIAIRAAGGPKHFLPESLVELWRAEKVPADHLPRLLATLEPKLLKQDYNLILHDRWKNRLGWIVGALLGVTVLVLLQVVDLPGGRPPVLPSLVLGWVVGMLGASVGGMLMTMHRRRCREQSRWALKEEEAMARAEATGERGYRPDSRRVGSRFGFFVKMYFTFLGILIAGFAGIGLTAWWIWG